MRLLTNPYLAIVAVLTLCPCATAEPHTDPANTPVRQGPAPVGKAAVFLAAQRGSPASLKGRVVDAETGKPLPSAALVLSRLDKPQSRLEEESQSDGSFSFDKLDPGEWSLTVSAEKMLSKTEKLVLKEGQSQQLTVALESQEGVDILRITGKRTLIHPEKIGSETHLDHKFIQEYGTGNSLRKLVETTPGVQRDSYGNIIVRGEHNALNYELDGVVLPEAAGVLQQSQFITPRALQAMNVDIGGYQAQDGGGPLGAVVHMKSRPIQSRPTFNLDTQIGGPLAGGIHYYASGALSQNPNSLLNRIRIESIGAADTSTYRLNPPVVRYRRNAGLDLSFFNRIDFQATEKDRFRLTGVINESFLQVPTSGTSKQFGVRQNQHERQDYFIVSYQRKFDKWLDEANLHVINAFYSQVFRARNAFDPLPIINGEEGQINSVAARAKRFNYAVSIQGDVRKQWRDHHLKAGFLTELRPVRTKFSALYYNANLLLAAQSAAETQAARDAARQAVIDEAEAQRQAAIASGDPNAIAALPTEQEVLQEAQAAAQSVPDMTIPYASPISPFTGQPGGPLFVGNIGRFSGFRYLQSAFAQDTWKPSKGFLRRFTVDAGIRVDVYHGVFGNTLPVAAALLTIPDVPPFSLAPFQKQSVTDAQASGRFGGSFVLTKNTVLRGSFSNLFMPPPVDVFVTPPEVDAQFNGIFNGTIRPMRATRGHLVDVSVEQQVGPRFATRTNFFYKKLKNFGDSGVIANTPIYNRLTLSNQEAMGVETRMDLRPGKDGAGLFGYLSNTIAIAWLRGSKSITGGIYEQEEDLNLKNYPDHDRRYSLNAGIGYRSRRKSWILADIIVQSGLLDSRDPAIYGPHPARTPPVTRVGLNAGYEFPARWREQRKFLPEAVDVRIENLLNQQTPLNLGSPFQGTRYQLPIRILAGMYWKV